MRTALIDVTVDDIEHGEKHACDNCPIARAVKRAIPDATEVLVYPRFIDLFRDGVPDLRAMTPREAEQFMRAFDARHIVFPFSFQITLHTVL